ncbi:uncharacterized protein LOC144664634 isoform X2 [Oculina patagonica]
MLRINHYRMVKDNLKTSMINSLVVIVLLSGNYEITIKASIVCSHSCNAFSETFNCKDSYTCTKPNDVCYVKCDGQLCEQACNPNAQTCALECDREICKQNCDYENGECGLKCHGSSCEQTCNGHKCTLQCHGSSCSQTCQQGGCTLECNAGSCEQACNHNCRLNCRGGQCNQICTGLSDGATCQLQYNDVNKYSQNCKDKEPQCTKFIAPTEAPTTPSEHCHFCTGTPLSQSTPLSSPPPSLTAAPSSSVTASVVATSSLLQSSMSLTSSIAFTSLASASSRSSSAKLTTITPLPLTRRVTTLSSSATASETNSIEVKNSYQTEELVSSVTKTTRSLASTKTVSTQSPSSVIATSKPNGIKSKQSSTTTITTTPSLPPTKNVSNVFSLATTSQSNSIGLKNSSWTEELESSTTATTTSLLAPTTTVLTVSSPGATSKPNGIQSKDISQTEELVSSTKTITTTPSQPPTTIVSIPWSSATPSNSNDIRPKNISRTEELVIMFLSTLNKIDVDQDSSLQDAVNLFQNTTEQFKNMSIQELQHNSMTEQERKTFIFKMTFAFEDFAIKYGQYHLNESKSQFSNIYGTLVLRIERDFHRNARDFHLEGPEKQNFINIPSSNFDGNGLYSVLLGVVYKDLHEILTSHPSSSDATRKKRRLDTTIMAATMDPKPKKLLQNIALNFKNLKVTRTKARSRLDKTADGKSVCVFWNGYSEQNPDGWSGEGCHVVTSKSNSEETRCSCDHMTHFAVLFDYGDNLEITKTDEKILRILTYVGLSLSITGNFLAIISYVYFTDVHQPLSQIRVSLAGSLGAGQITFLAGINATGNTGACVAVAALMQYFLMAAFCWMLVEGIYLYFFVVKVYNINNKMTIYHVMSWCFPAVMVAMSLSIAAGKDGIQSFVSDAYCWMSSANDLMWIFVAFVVMIEVVNMLLLVRVIKEMTTMQSTGDNHIQQIRIGIKACVVMVPLLGVTWLFGLLTPLHKAFVYIFTILNSVQGFLIFLLHCVRNTQIKDRFKRRMNAIFPFADNGNLAAKSSQVNSSDIVLVNRIEVQSRCGSVFELK